MRKHHAFLSIYFVFIIVDSYLAEIFKWIFHGGGALAPSIDPPPLLGRFMVDIVRLTDDPFSYRRKYTQPEGGKAKDIKKR